MRLPKLSVGSIAALALVPTVSFAIGQLTEPIVVSNARRGQVIEEIMMLVSETTDQTYALGSEGDIALWVQFFKPGDSSTPITQIAVPASQNKTNVVARITVPDDTRNGVYKGLLTVSRALADQSEIKDTGAVVGQRISRKVEITVTDKEDIAFTAEFVPEGYEVKPGAALPVKITFRNRGNVQITPAVRMRILNLDGDQVLSDITSNYPQSEPPVKPRESGTITVQLASFSLAEGKYRAEFTALQGEIEGTKDSFKFSVTPQAGRVLGASTTAGGNWLLVIGIAAVAVIAAAIVVFARKRSGSV